MSPGRQLVTVLWIALAILLLVRLTAVGPALAVIPVVGASLPFFVLAVVVLAWRLREGDGRASFGLTAPPSWWRTLLVAAAAVAARFAVSAVVEPLLARAGAAPDLTRLDAIRGDRLALLWIVPAMWIVAAAGEEVLHRGFVMTRLARLWGGHGQAWVRALFVSAAIFGVGHTYQGWGGALLTGISALIFGGAFLLTGRNLWAPMLAHGIGNTIVLVQAAGGGA